MNKIILLLVKRGQKVLKFLHQRIFLIFLLNGILILIPLVEYYSIQKHDYQINFRRRVTMIETANWLARYIANEIKNGKVSLLPLEEPFSLDIPTIAPKQRSMGITKSGICLWDTGWVVNNDYYYFSGSKSLQKLERIIPQYPRQPEISREEILNRLLPKFNQPRFFVGIIDYNFTYTLIPIIIDSHFFGHALVICSKWDILQYNRLSKAFIFLVSIISLLLGVFISFVYYISFLVPLKRLAQDSINMQKTGRLSPSLFSLKNRQDEIGQLGRAFFNAAASLDEKRTALENFTADILHELKNPLSAIRNGAMILEEDNEINSNFTPIIQMIKKESGRIEKLLFEIKEISSFEKPYQQERHCCPNKVTLEVLELYKRYNVKINLALSSTTRIPLAPKEWARIVKNLLDNAVDFSSKPGTITLDLELKNNRVFLTLTDSGSGITAGDEKKIFQRFYSRRGKDNSLHSGLGLAIVKALTESGGGRAWCENKDPEKNNHGACFIVEMPLL